MKRIIVLVFLAGLIFSCGSRSEISSIDPVNWTKREVCDLTNDSLERGTSYLSVYSQIYSMTEHRTHDLTVTVSMRNANVQDTIYLDKAKYFDTHGELIRTYFYETIFIAPMETVEIVIDEKDQAGGTGANFIFDWRIYPMSIEPIFEGVMISTSGQQGLSFTTQAKRIH